MASISEGLFAARAGIQSHGAAISVLADNIANANTTGFKASRAEFYDLLAGNLGGSGSDTAVGSGSEVNKIRPVFNQGSLEFTDRGLDVAIEGNGLFVVQDTSGTGQRFYSRAGNFSIDSSGDLINQNGYQVLGFAANGTGGLEALNINSASQSNVATSAVTISGNLNADSTALSSSTPETGVTSFDDLADSAEYSTTYDVYDSLGQSHAVTTYFFHIPTSGTAAATWRAVTVAPESETTSGGDPSLPKVLNAVSFSFDTSGQLTTAFTPQSVSQTWASGATGGGTGGVWTVDFDPITQFATDSTIDHIVQDGTGAGSIIGFVVEQDGSLFAQLDNGQTTSIGTVAVANFENIEGLRRVGNSLFAESLESGEPVVGTPGTGRFGALQGGALEQSTTDIADDFIKLISFQRAFQGSSRIIGAIDNLLNEIVNIA